MKQKYSQETHNTVIDTLRTVIKSLAHVKKYGSGRLETALEKALGPEHVVYCSRTYVKIWGNGADYDNGIFICSYNLGNPDWAEKLMREIDVQDTRDSAERREDEKILTPALELLNAKAVKLLDELQLVRDAANNAIARLPVPACATVRKESVYWSWPSSELKSQFPNLFV